MPDAAQISELLAKAQQGFTLTSAIVAVLAGVFLIEIQTFVSVTGTILGVYFKNSDWYGLERKSEFSHPRDLIAFLCTFAAAFLVLKLGFCQGDFSASKPDYISFFCIWGIIVGFFLYRLVIFSLISWVTGVKDLSSSLFSSALSYFILFTLSLFLMMVLRLLIPALTQRLSFLICLGILAFLNLSCDIKAYIKLRSNGFSSFFAFLYLCALEILPVAVFSKAVITF